MKVVNVTVMLTMFLIGAISSSISGLWHPYVTVKIKNVSQQPLSEIEMKFQNTEGKGIFNLYLVRPEQLNCSNYNAIVCPPR